MNRAFRGRRSVYENSHLGEIQPERISVNSSVIKLPKPPMYISYRKSKIDPRKLDEIVRLVNEGLMPILYESVGFVSYEMFLDDDNYICSVNMFTTRAAMEEANAAAGEWAREHLAELLKGSIVISQGASLLERRRLERLY
jgi:hypothetical protein